MGNLSQAVWIELLKARRTKMLLFTTLGFSLIPLVGGLFMIILKDPQLARRIGLISVKAEITMGSADWPSYLGFLSLAIAASGIILFGFIVSYVFGREYSDRTVKDLLALPTSRSTIVLAKFVIVGSWSLVLTLLVLLLGFVVGILVGLPPVSSQMLWQGSINVSITAVLTILLVTPIAFFASAGRGYIPPMVAAFLAMAIAQVVAVLGWGEFFPWAIPGLYSQGEELGILSYVILMLTSLAGFAGTFLWWELADQT